jgi:SAM-dependent MidA family methyltransferase
VALYHPEAGFYSAGSGAGRGGGDFLTSPEVGPLFGRVFARALDDWWSELGHPDPYVVVEAGAGAGTLAAAVLAAAPRCAPALRYVTVERSARMRASQADRLALELPALVLGPTAIGDADDEERRPVPGTGPLVTALAELPAVPVTGVVLANELLDNLGFALLERGREGWQEVRVGVDQERLVEVMVAAPPDVAAEAGRLAPEAAEGARIPLQHQAADWVRSALAVVQRGRVVAVDYASTTPDLAARPWTDWLRTYRGQGRGGHPIERPGSQDVTCEVAVDQLARVVPPTADSAQSDFLRRHGLDDLVDAARVTWEKRAVLGDLAAMQARSTVAEGRALIDPTGLGGFRVLQWEV